jgi:hypothetical protein
MSVTYFSDHLIDWQARLHPMGRQNAVILADITIITMDSDI